MESYAVYKGDTTFNIPFHIINYDSTDKDLTSLIPKLKVWYPTKPATLLFSGSTTIDTALSGLCHYIVTSTDLLVTGTYLAEVEIWNTTSGLVQTWDQFKLVIKESPTP
jgi:hypothetical protein